MKKSIMMPLGIFQPIFSGICIFVGLFSFYIVPKRIKSWVIKHRALKDWLKEATLAYCIAANDEYP